MAGVTDSSQALAGVTVLDLATFLAAPLCATLLGEFGADVIKVEQPGVGDDLRRLGPAGWRRQCDPGATGLSCKNLPVGDGRLAVDRVDDLTRTVVEIHAQG